MSSFSKYVPLDMPNNTKILRVHIPCFAGVNSSSVLVIMI